MHRIGAKNYKTRHDWRGRLSTGNCARDWDLIILPNGICTTQNPFLRMRRSKFTGILRYHLIFAGRPDIEIVKKKKKKKKKRICQILDFAVSSDHWIKLKEIKKRVKYLDLAREIKKIWNIKVAMIPIVIVMLGKDTKGMVKGMVKRNRRLGNNSWRPSNVQHH